jgi:hypothetical protein
MTLAWVSWRETVGVNPLLFPAVIAKALLTCCHQQQILAEQIIHFRNLGIKCNRKKICKFKKQPKDPVVFSGVTWNGDMSLERFWLCRRV